MRKLTTAWAAGLFEGEGTITRLTPDGHRWQAAIVSTDEDVLRTFQSVMGGKVYGPYVRGKDHWKPQWRWCVADKEGFLRFAKRIGPYLHSRRKAKLDEAVADLAQVRTTRKTHVNTLSPDRKWRTN